MEKHELLLILVVVLLKDVQKREVLPLVGKLKFPCDWGVDAHDTKPW